MGLQMRLNAEREMYFGKLLQRAANTAGPGGTSGSTGRGSEPREGSSAGNSSAAHSATQQRRQRQQQGWQKERRNQQQQQHRADRRKQKQKQQGQGSQSGHGVSSKAAREGLDHVVRFVESFERPDRDFWLVFRDEGMSLHTLMYDHVALGGADAHAGTDHINTGPCGVLFI